MDNHRNTQPLTRLASAIAMIADPRGSEIRYFQGEFKRMFELFKREERSYTVPTRLHPDQFQRLEALVEDAAAYLVEHSESSTSRDHIVAGARAFVSAERTDLSADELARIADLLEPVHAHPANIRDDLRMAEETIAGIEAALARWHAGHAGEREAHADSTGLEAGLAYWQAHAEALRARL